MTTKRPPALRLRRPHVPGLPGRQRLRLQAEQQAAVQLQRGRHDRRVAAGSRLLRLRERPVSRNPKMQGKSADLVLDLMGRHDIRASKSEAFHHFLEV